MLGMYHSAFLDTTTRGHHIESFSYKVLVLLKDVLFIIALIYYVLSSI